MILPMDGDIVLNMINNWSPSLATMRGPGNFPFTDTMLFVWHRRVTILQFYLKNSLTVRKLKMMNTSMKISRQNQIKHTSNS